MLQNLLQISLLHQFFDFIFVHVNSVVEVTTPEDVVMGIQTTTLHILISQLIC